MLTDQAWIKEARKYIGLREIKGANHSPEILQFWKDIKRGGIKDDETPWCAAFVGAMLERAGIQSSRSDGSKSFLNWGVKLNEPTVGCIVVFTRDGGGHVGFVVGRDAAGNLLVLGGNQSDAVNVKAFGRDRVVGYRWPASVPVPVRLLPVLASADFSTSEA